MHGSHVCLHGSHACLHGSHVCLHGSHVCLLYMDQTVYYVTEFTLCSVPMATNMIAFLLMTKYREVS